MNPLSLNLFEIEILNDESLYSMCRVFSLRKKNPARSHAEELVEKRLGIGLEDMDASQIGLYIPELDAYCHECGDTNYIEFTCVGGLVNGSVYTLEFKADMDWDYIYSHVQTTLEETEDGYRFIANQSLSVPSSDSGELFGEPIGVETAWEYLKAACFSECGLEEISYDESSDDFQVVLDRFELAFGDEDAERPCASVVFLEETDGDYYRFGHYYVFYDEDTVYATQTKGWYLVNRLTGEVSIP